MENKVFFSNGPSNWNNGGQMLSETALWHTGPAVPMDWWPLLRTNWAKLVRVSKIPLACVNDGYLSLTVDSTQVLVINW